MPWSVPSSYALKTQMSLALMGASAAWAQEPGLLHRPASAAAPAPPAPVRVPQTLEPARGANANGLYQALRTRFVNGEAFTVTNLVLHRDAGVLTLTSGTVYFYGQTAGRVTGAVFLGEGVLHVEPPSAMGRRQLKAVMKTEVLDQRFTSAVFAFTDETAAELKKGAVASAAGSGAAVARAEETQTLFRRDLHYNLEARLFEDVVRSGAGGFFLAEMQQTIDATIEKNGKLKATAVTAVTARQNGVQVLPLAMFPSLRVSDAWGPSGEALDFVY